MNILRALIVTIIGVFILMTLWPLFVFLVIAFGLYWLVISLRLRQMGQTIKEDYNRSTTNPSDNKDVIDAQYTERSE
jgi:ABC-type bacteriocin/lantibiotic exporter with double-glycine peptidase domain